VSSILQGLKSRRSKRLWALAAVAGCALMTAPASALGIDATPLSPSSLAYPAAFTATPGGNRIYYGERYTGEIRRLNRATGATTLFSRIPSVATSGEAGLLGLALHPDYPDNRNVWAFVTRTVGGTTVNQLVRVRPDGAGFAVLRDFPTASFHNGGRIMFGPEGKLYVVIGENDDPSNAQNLGNLAGKMLRLNPDGSVPADNPQRGKAVIAYGIRNSFGFTFDPQAGHLWATENGPECNDEVNLIPRHALTNFGWGPSQSCDSPPPAPRNTNRDGPDPVLPRLSFDLPPALTGAAFCDGCGLASPGALFIGDYNEGQIHRAALTPERRDIASQSVYYDHPDPILSVETPADGGPLYFSTPTNIFRLRL
jgi:glucose/arabinose dehydrogenase